MKDIIQTILSIFGVRPKTKKATTKEQLIDSIKDGRFTLDGRELETNGNFSCSYKGLTTLEGAPTNVQHDFFCSGNMLTSLVGGPHIVNGTFVCSSNRLSSFEGFPSEIHGGLNCSSNRLSSLHNIHFHIKVIDTALFAINTDITSCVLGLLKIERLSLVTIDNKDVQKIISKYLPLGDILDCQEELVEAGYEEYAQL